MIIYLSNTAFLTGLSPELEEAVKTELTISNPLLKMKENLGLSLWNIAPVLTYYKKTTETGIEIPIGALPTVLELAKAHKVFIRKEDIIDKRVSNMQTSYFSTLKFTGTLRDYQQNIVNACEPKTVGVIEAMTGSGKTITFVALTLKKKEATLILVDTIELATQTKKAFLKFTNIKEEQIGLIGDGVLNLKPVTIALHQSMAKMNDELFSLLSKTFGMIIADEVHICPANTYYKTMTHLAAKYKFGFSATPEREDGLTKAIFWSTGPHIHKVPPEALKEHLIKPSIEYIKTSYWYPLMTTQEYQDLLSDMAIDEDRNTLILKTLNEDYADNFVVMLCARRSQVHYFYEQLGPERAVFMLSKMPKKQRKAAMEQILNKKVKIMISTYGLFSKGIDVPHLEIGMLCAPIVSKVKLTQTSGRIMRPAEGKTFSKLVDFYDPKVELLHTQYYRRKRIFKNIVKED
jgi:superfamily II DNA or RNA helicase